MFSFNVSKNVRFLLLTQKIERKPIFCHFLPPYDHINHLYEIVYKFLLAGDKFMPKMHLKQPGFTYRACGPFRKSNERIKKFMQPVDTRYIYRNDLEKASFQHDMAYGSYKNLVKYDKVVRDKVFKVASNPGYDGYERGLASMVYKFFL